MDGSVIILNTTKMKDVIFEKRVSRLAFNTNGWIMPSGPYGKSLSADSYEAMYGFGHEEWLFDVSKLINGFHYGFLEPIRKQQHAYAGNSYSVWLYTIDSKSKKRFWVGEIEKVEVLTKKEANTALRLYKSNGWYSEMENQVIAAGGDKKAFANWHDVDLFNIRFEPNYLKVNDPYIEISANHPVISQPRYNFTHFNDSFAIDSIRNFSFLQSIENDILSDIEIETKSHIRESKSIEITYLHNLLSKKVTVLLRQKYGVNNVTPEHSTGIGGNRIDIVVNSKKDGLIFYEIKTYNSLITSVREAIGQLMEYSYYPKRENASKLIILTQKHHNDADVIPYIKYIRNKFNLPLYYQWYDLQSDTLSEIY